MIAISLLKKFAFLKDLTNDQLIKLEPLAKEETHQAGTQLYMNGDPARCLYLVQEGKVALFMDNYMGPGKPPMQVTIDIVAPGESMGWSAVVEPYHYTLSARCLEDTKLIAFDAEQLRDLMDSDPALGYKLMQATAKVISSRLTHTRIILVGERGLSTLTEY
jgi:CRP-like cAMP-binding protein